MRWMRSSLFLRGLLVLLLVPAAVLLALAGYTWLANLLIAPGMVRPAVSPQVVWPWQDAAYLITIDPLAEVTEQEPPPPLDIAFLVDVSGSMLESLPAMSEAAQRMTEELARSRGGDVRFALVRFDTEAEVLTPWTGDPEQLSAGLQQLAPITGENDSRLAFVRLDELLAEARDDATRAVVFYTDGVISACNPWTCPGEVMSESEIVEAAQSLRERGIDLYSVGVPGYGSHPLMLEVTGAACRVFDPADVRDLAVSFRFLADSVLGGSGSGARIGNHLDGRHFATPLAGTGWTQSASGTLLLDIGPLPAAATTYLHPLRPRSAGLWRVGTEPPTITWVDESRGGLVRAAAARRPAMLVITWFALLLAGLPALLWILAHLPRRPAVALEEEPFPAPPPVRHPLPPARLPSLPPIPGARTPVVPTLFLGLGGGGRRALHAVRAQLKQAHPVAGSELPYRFLWLDVDTTEQERDLPFDTWDEYPLESLQSSPEISRVGDDLPEPGRVPPHLRWFDAERYHDAAREDLNLSRGSHGDSMLARLALLRWLESALLLPELLKCCRDLVQHPTADGTSQVVVFAGWDGGVGSGWFLDTGRLLQRIGRHLQRQGVMRYVPELIGVLCAGTSQAEDGNRRALELELESAMMTGRLPVHTCYAEDHELLDQTDTESPYHWVVSLTAPDELSVAAQCGEIAALLVERPCRQQLLAACRELSEGETEARRAPVSVRTSSLQVLPRLVQDQVQSELLLRMLGPDVLLDIAAATGGGFVPQELSQSETGTLLAGWAAAEPPGTPLQLLLSSALEPAAAAILADTLQRGCDQAGEQLGVAFIASLNRQLHGAHRDGIWQRGLTPAAAMTVLRLLARRLRDGLPTVPGAERIADLATVAASGLESWLAQLCTACERLGQQGAQLAASAEALHRASWRTTLELHGCGEIATWSRQVLERWLGSADTISPLRERLFFATVAHGDHLQIEVRSFIDEPRVLSDGAAVVSELSELTARLVRGLKVARIGGALSVLVPDERERLARDLVDRSTRPERVVVVAPQTRGLPVGETRAIEAFCSEVPRPPDHGLHQEVGCGDGSAIRRIELQRQPPGESSSERFVSTAEQESERLRLRIRRFFQREIPVLPPQLRIALAHPQAFRSFARAYRTGHIVRREDAAGIAQWYLRNRDLQLTFGGNNGLAAAAAGYVLRVSDPPEQFAEDGDGDFTLLHRWLAESGVASDEILVLAAVETTQSRQARGGGS